MEARAQEDEGARSEAPDGGAYLSVWGDCPGQGGILSGFVAPKAPPWFSQPAPHLARHSKRPGFGLSRSSIAPPPALVAAGAYEGVVFFVKGLLEGWSNSPLSWDRTVAETWLRDKPTATCEGGAKGRSGFRAWSLRVQEKHAATFWLL